MGNLGLFGRSSRQGQKFLERFPFCSHLHLLPPLRKTYKRSPFVLAQGCLGSRTEGTFTRVLIFHGNTFTQYFSSRKEMWAGCWKL